jgi:hypothetical protein
MLEWFRGKAKEYGFAAFTVQCLTATHLLVGIKLTQLHRLLPTLDRQRRTNRYVVLTPDLVHMASSSAINSE